VEDNGKDERQTALALWTPFADAGTGQGLGQIPRAFPFVSHSRHLKDICLSFYAVFGTVLPFSTAKLFACQQCKGRSGRGLIGMTVSLVWHWQHIANTFAAGAVCKRSAKQKCQQLF